jgi:hypothetical protein
MLRSLALVAAACAALAQNPCIGNLPLVIDGVLDSSWSIAVAGSDHSGVSLSGNSVSVKHDYRAYVVNECSDSGFTPGMYAKRLSFLNKTLSFTVDLSSVGCSCNAALYAVAMPAYNQSQVPVPTTCGDFYCDANNVCGVYCTEMDVMEANTAAFQVTPHKCDAPQGNYFPHCDGGGCGVNSYKTNPKAFGPGSSYTIDTTKPFNVSTTFAASNSGGQLNSVVSSLTQGSGRFVLTHADSNCGSGYLEAMTDSMASGMVITFSLWGASGPTMQWLDSFNGLPCPLSTACDPNSVVTFSNLALTSL